MREGRPRSRSCNEKMRGSREEGDETAVPRRRRSDKGILGNLLRGEEAEKEALCEGYYARRKSRGGGTFFFVRGGGGNETRLYFMPIVGRCCRIGLSGLVLLLFEKGSNARVQRPFFSSWKNGREWRRLHTPPGSWRSRRVAAGGVAPFLS